MPDQAPLARTGGEGALAASGAISITPQMTPCTSPQTSPMGSPLASCLPEVKPFDMWAGQAEQVRVLRLSWTDLALLHTVLFLLRASLSAYAPAGIQGQEVLPGQPCGMLQ